MEKSAVKTVIIVLLALLVLAAAVVLIVLYCNGTIKYTSPAKSGSGKYLFCYFTGNEPENERIHLALSEDGYNFEPLNNNNAVIEQTLGKKSVRDPYIFRGNDGYFYIIGTDMRSDEGWTSNHALISRRSSDLINWTDETVLDIRSFGGEFQNVNRAWAPQAVWDDEKGQYMVYFALSTEENDTAAIYYSYTRDFKTLTEPQLLYKRDGIQTIDADIVYNESNKKYYMYFKHDEDSKIAYTVSDSLTGPYESEAKVVSHASSGVEGSEMYNITGTDVWVMIMDEYGKDRFVMEQTTDFEGFVKVKKGGYTFGFSQRHGSVMAISDEEYEALKNAVWSNEA